jgi:hypothetical protein
MTIGLYSTLRRFLSFRSDSAEISRYVSTAEAKLRQGFLRFAPE